MIKTLALDTPNVKITDNDTTIRFTPYDDGMTLTPGAWTPTVYLSSGKSAFTKSIPAIWEGNVVVIQSSTLADLPVDKYDVEVWLNDGSEQLIYPDYGYVKLNINQTVAGINANLYSSVTVAEFREMFNSLATDVKSSVTALANDSKAIHDATNAVIATKANQSDLNTTNKNVASNSAKIADNTSKIASLASGSPMVVSFVADMTDHTKNYVYTGTESGYLSGNWYYWSGSMWLSGGTYQSTQIADESVARSKLNFTPLEGTYGKNLFDKSKVTTGKYVRFIDGTLSDNIDYSASDYIKIDGNTNYYVNFGNQIPFYNSNKTFISGINYDSSFPDGGTFTTPAGASFLRVSIANTNLSAFQLEKGYSGTSYQPFGVYALAGETIINNANVEDESLSVNKIVERETIPLMILGKNLFDKSKVTPGYYVSNGSGKLSINSSYSASDYIKINPGTSYTISPTYDQVAFFDTNKQYISGIGGTQQSKTTITTPTNATYIRVSVFNSVLDKYQLEQGSTATDFEPFQYVIPEKNIPTTAKPVKTPKQIMSEVVLASTTKRVKFIGDSITAGFGGTGYATTGDVVYGSYQANPDGHNWANSMVNYLQEKFNVVAKNYGVNGRTSWDLLINLDSIVHSDDDIIIMMIGTNDRIMTNKIELSATYSYISRIVSHLKSLGKEIILMSSIPASVDNENADRRFHMEDVNNVIMKVASDFGTEHISLYQLFTEYCENHNISIDSLLIDGLHPTDAGYDVMFELVSNALGIATKRIGANW